MERNVWTFVLVLLFFGGIVAFATSDIHLPGNNEGYRPVQPIAYSHRLHAGELRIDCLYCHYGATRSRNAGIPSASICMNCHKLVTSGFDAMLEEKQLAEAEGRPPNPIISAELQKLYDALALNNNLEPDPAKTPKPIEWIRVHNLPDYVYFDHRVHVARGVSCDQCHGLVQGMERVRQEFDLSMGWCLDCHRKNPKFSAGSGQEVSADLIHQETVSTDCASCHF